MKVVGFFYKPVGSGIVKMSSPDICYGGLILSGVLGQAKFSR